MAKKKETIKDMTILKRGTVDDPESDGKGSAIIRFNRNLIFTVNIDLDSSTPSISGELIYNGESTPWHL